MSWFATNIDFLIRTCFALDSDSHNGSQKKGDTVEKPPRPGTRFRMPSPSEKTESVLSFSTFAESCVTANCPFDTTNSDEDTFRLQKLHRRFDISQEELFNREEMRVEGLLWSGRFGSSLLAKCTRHDDTVAHGHEYVTLNTYHKTVLQETYQQHIPRRELELLRSFDHPFISTVLGSFSDRNSLYLVSPAETGGPLSHLLRNSLSNGITDSMKTFYAGCVLSVLKYAHGKNIIHRGLHPDSLLLDSTGYLKVTDWGFAKIVTDRTYTLCGHVEYLCPEAIIHDCGYGKGADYWALGVLIYEMFVGRSAFVSSSLDFKYDVSTPFEDRAVINLGSQHDSGGKGGNGVNDCASSISSVGSDHSHSHDTGTIENILSRQPIYPSYMSCPAKSIIQGLCQKNVTQRLGTRRGGKGVEDILAHIFFRDIQWGRLNKKLVTAPWIPSTSCPEESSKVESCAHFYPNYVPNDKIESEQLLGPTYTGYNCQDWHTFDE